MYNHEPLGYECPFCRIVKTASDVKSDKSPTDIIYHSEMATGFLALGRWPQNPVDILVVPNRHIENLYDLPLNYVVPIHQATRAIAIGLKEVYRCDGISTRQHNEPAGNQDVWHYHVHITPRFSQDGFYKSCRIDFPEAERLEAAHQLRDYIHTHQEELHR
jgi:histidine triad (HIT) family protein